MSAIREREALRAEISAFCKKLVLSQRAVQLCETEATPKQEEFLHRVLSEEMESRERSRRTRLLSRAGFPVYKTLEGYERHGVKLPSSLQWSDLTEGTFIEGRRNLVLYGPVGTGKTHLAIAAGLRACELGMTVKFYTVAELVMRLAEAKRGGTLERLMSEIQRCQLLILDEWGYIPVDKDGAQLLFRVIADSYESRSLVITTNLEFSKWGTVFTDDQMAAAMIDRLAHHGHLLVFEGESYRMKHALMKER
ncbi:MULTISPECIES: IS21-like element helper ATPase IstB [Paenibacillus]|uniref:IS21-like element helper ATPase IstB n=2 Tax=Paenibacillus TaxID=44249 RepID=UPI0010B561BD|nr:MULTISPECIES: IS21-like element helper ATPase IstB [Paenibacillus]NTZ16239.1 ATP-binding protein [Paenibacillus sp. JMULE4]GCL74885.1 ATP-binding protein [Paenibacillus naphthalenovorans]